MVISFLSKLAFYRRKYETDYDNFGKYYVDILMDCYEGLLESNYDDFYNLVNILKIKDFWMLVDYIIYYEAYDYFKDYIERIKNDLDELVNYLYLSDDFDLADGFVEYFNKHNRSKYENLINYIDEKLEDDSEFIETIYDVTTDVIYDLRENYLSYLEEYADKTGRYDLLDKYK